MIGVLRERLRSRIMRAVVKPSIPGMRTSMRIAAKSSSRTARSAASPDDAVTRRAPSPRSTSSMARRLPRSSSTMRMLAWRSVPMFVMSFGQHQERLAAEHSRGGIRIHRVERLARALHELRLPAQAAQLGGARGVEMVDHLVAGVLEERERGLLAEVVDVAYRAAHVEQLEIG